MAIQFARLQYVKRSKGQSSCHKSAYNARDNIYDFRKDRWFSYKNRNDNAYHAVMLPTGVSGEYQNISQLWNTIESVENRCDSQVAKEMVLALPDDPKVTIEDKIAMVRVFLQEHFVSKGIICQIDIHKPHDDENPGHNWHAHVLMPTRRCEGELFGYKATDLDVDVRKGRVVSTDRQWGVLWADCQNRYCKENGIDLRVDPIGVVPQFHRGPERSRFKAVKDLEDEIQKEDQKENARKAQDERLVLQQLLAHESTFIKQDVEAFAEKHLHEKDRPDFLGRFWNNPELVLVGEEKYTSKIVLQEEQKIMRIADRLIHKQAREVEPQHQIELTPEQQAAFDYVREGAQLSLIEGKAGTGKSYVLCALRDSYQAAGFKVRGLTPSNALAADMRRNGFSYAANVRSFLFTEYHTSSLNIQRGRELWLVDEAAMVSNSDMGELLQKAWRYNAHLVLVGDTQQLSAIGRGGVFQALTERFGSVTLENVVRQQEETDRTITACIAQGQTELALEKMITLNRWHHFEREFDAVRAMMDQWYRDYRDHPFDSFIILEYRNQFVKEFNRHIHAVLRARGEVGREDVNVRTAQFGFLQFGVGDSLIFRQNDPVLGVHNGQRGILVSVLPHEFTVRIDDTERITFDPTIYTDFQHGYAGTIHKAQGLTFDHVYALHSHHIDQNIFYVANSRHRLSCHYFSYGRKEQVREDIKHSCQKELSPQSCAPETSRDWLCNLVMSLKDFMTTNHEFYCNSARHYVEKGVLITDKAEEARLSGYRTFYREDRDNWPSLEGQSVQMSSQHRDLETFLRDQRVDQCLLHDVQQREERQLIGPYDRFHQFFKTHPVHQEDRLNDCTEMQMRMRLFALEKQYNESPQSLLEMEQSRAYVMFMSNETILKPELLKEYDIHMANQLLYHVEKTGEMPTSLERHVIQQRVTIAQQQYASYKTDHIFMAAMSKGEHIHQKQMSFEQQQEMER